MRWPTPFGLKVTLKVTEAPDFTSLRVNCSMMKSLLWVPVMLKDRSVNLRVPVLRIVNLRPMPLLVFWAVPKLIFEISETKLFPAGCCTSISGAEMAI